MYWTPHTHTYTHAHRIPNQRPKIKWNEKKDSISFFLPNSHFHCSIGNQSFSFSSVYSSDNDGSMVWCSLLFGICFFFQSVFNVSSSCLSITFRHIHQFISAKREFQDCFIRSFPSIFFLLSAQRLYKIITVCVTFLFD